LGAGDKRQKPEDRPAAPSEQSPMLNGKYSPVEFSDDEVKSNGEKQV
jgi:hypothetical protein